MTAELPQRRTPEEFVTTLTAAVTERLSRFGLDMDPTEAATIIAKWADHVAREKKFERSSILYSTDEQLAEIADSLVMELLGEIAEERPGTDPWEHESNIPLSMPILMMQVTYLSLCANIAIHNDAKKWALHANASASSIVDAILEQITAQTPEVTTHQVLHNGEKRTVYGQTVQVPQPALAAIARFYENVVFHVERGIWLLEDPADEEERFATISTLTNQAALLRDLNERFGRPAGPRKLS